MCTSLTGNRSLLDTFRAQAQLTVTLPKREEVREYYNCAMVAVGCQPKNGPNVQTVVARFLSMDYSPHTSPIHTPFAVPMLTQNLAVERSSPTLSSLPENEGLVRIHQVATALFPTNKTLIMVDYFTRSLIQGEEEEQKIEILAAIDAIPLSDRESVLSAVHWFRPTIFYEHKLPLIHNFARIPSTDRAMIAEAVLDNRDGMSFLVTQKMDIDWGPILHILATLPKRERSPFLVGMSSLSPFLTKENCAALSRTLHEVHPNERIEVANLSAREMTGQMSSKLLCKLMKVIAELPREERRAVIQQARAWILGEKKHFWLADVIDVIVAIP